MIIKILNISVVLKSLLLSICCQFTLLFAIPRSTLCSYGFVYSRILYKSSHMVSIIVTAAFMLVLWFIHVVPLSHSLFPSPSPSVSLVLPLFLLFLHCWGILNWMDVSQFAYLFIRMLMDFQVVSNFGLFKVRCYEYLYTGNILQFLLKKYWRVEMVGHTMCKSFLRSCGTFL